MARQESRRRYFGAKVNHKQCYRLDESYIKARCSRAAIVAQLMPSLSPVPPDVSQRVALALLADGHLRTVADLRLVSAATYDIVTPVLFSTFTIDGDTPALDVSEPDEEAWTAHEREGGAQRADFFGAGEEATRRRRIDNLRHVRHLVIRSPPSPELVSKYTDSELRRPLFPQAIVVSLSASMTESLRTYIPSYDSATMSVTISTPRPPLLDWLTSAARPRRLSISFPLVPSSQWEAHRDGSTRGSYQLASRLASLVDPGSAWHGVLQEFKVDGIVHQVLPALRGVKNIYHFANHQRSSSPHYHSPSSSLVSLPPGPASTGMPGPEWNFRAWQISTTVKSLFPSVPTSRTPSANPNLGSGHDNDNNPKSSFARETLANTSWTFRNIAGHVLTKDDRDDDDELGVEWSEVGVLVRDLVENGLRLDLPAREGFGEGELDELFQRLGYVDDPDVM